MPRVRRCVHATTKKPIGYGFHCPGCGLYHAVNLDEANPHSKSQWTFNGDMERPTFSPSLLVRSGCHSVHHNIEEGCWCSYNKEHPNEPAPFKCGTCHSFIRDGRIQFLNDCTHALAGKTVDLPEVESNGAAKE